MEKGLLKKHSGGSYLSSEDFGERLGKDAGVILTIADLTEANVAREDQKPEYKLIIHFEDSKPLVANKTNTNMLTALFGTDETKVLGCKIGLWVNPEVEHKGKMVKGLRLCDQKEIGEFGDDIPF